MLYMINWKQAISKILDIHNYRKYKYTHQYNKNQGFIIIGCCELLVGRLGFCFLKLYFRSNAKGQPYAGGER